jgi:tetratricopeptide (TPR) repeat protein
MPVRAAFCPHCGHAVTTGNQGAWIAAAAVVLACALGIAFVLLRPRPVPRPDMGDGSALPAPTRPAPDISTLTPRQGFDLLYDRVMAAAQKGDSVTMVRLTEHALGAYTQIGRPDADARYHLAVLHAQVGQFPEALALADSILAADPRDLLGLLVRGTVAELEKDAAALARARRDFLASWPGRDLKRTDYQDHQAVLDAFRAAAEAKAP